MFWENFYNLCIQNNTKPVPLIKSLGIAGGNATKWKNGTIPNGDTLIKLAEFFGCSVDYLLGIEGKYENLQDKLEIEILDEIHPLNKAEKEEILNYIRYTKSKRK